MEADRFNPDDFPRGRARRLELEFEAGGHAMRLPVLLARGAEPGKRLVATAAVHGDEYEGVRAIFDFFAGLDPSNMRGDFLAVPVANPPAFFAVSRSSPLDGLNLARVFPGVRDGSPTEAIAWRLDQQVIRCADFYIDLHSGGVRFEMPRMLGYWSEDAVAADAARAFGAPLLWSHPEVAPGRTVSAATSRRIPWLYTEMRGGGRIDAGDLEWLGTGLGNLLRHLGILEGTPTSSGDPLRLHGNGDIDASLSASDDGFLAPCVRLLDQVAAGQTLGSLNDVLGNVVESYCAPQGGRVALVHACPLVRKGEPVFLVCPEATV